MDLGRETATPPTRCPSLGFVEGPGYLAERQLDQQADDPTLAWWKHKGTYPSYAVGRLLDLGHQPNEQMGQSWLGGSTRELKLHM